MQQFVVPQFIDVEDKIIGPVTTRQFLIILAGALLLFIEYKLIKSLGLFILGGLITLLFTSAFAFMKVNGMPLHFFFINVLQWFQRPKLRIWGKDTMMTKMKKITTSFPITTPVAKRVGLSRSRLSELTLIIDTGGAYQGDDEAILNHKLSGQKNKF
ncbi:hypothetical protein A3J61_00810 [Candidatus Nomurabacteria bacterium RIFCSPHIGHO2_02_FULL_38_15]|uniref:PrgI family protein n=1 Tax=Candidatus Nomurabacteria bacterium RIFCSPHIGHO2_02_FULL_38_15 TaxID=1801752 RepID=A0A1F6VPP3_9BACT|nr:MAG: hypothetical protein A3J61_00810 [Candidatus Nomurabacteria bacterium RIFCSPHIGHO2_02_FULL_38_15]